jgi:DNA replication and repair protein RecF
MVSPSDNELILGGSEERRRFMDVAISQHDKEYLTQLINYEKALQQRNALLKMEEEPDAELLSLWEEMMAQAGSLIYERRKAFIESLVPIFQEFYSQISGDREEVSLTYLSHGDRGALLDVIRDGRAKDRIMGYSLHGVHKDDLVMQLGSYPIKREGSQGQSKTYLIALKLAQFDFLRRTGHTTPILLLDDIFDRLDASRVEQIVHLVSGDTFGQIFISDVNRGHLDRILSAATGDYKLYTVSDGAVQSHER